MYVCIFIYTNILYIVIWPADHGLGQSLGVHDTEACYSSMCLCIYIYIYIMYIHMCYVYAIAYCVRFLIGSMLHHIIR